ncbi:hypothetical protein [Bacillus alkalicellulosilyticus]|uniref:hypothetical protein n=1 Tax=Alkalihalobacterium alkalicellulosilyticum TaxID=1912214 RepID=UPI000997B9DF|nr:hypothetical protein [Bacillus alkalicellulosilyticus]
MNLKHAKEIEGYEPDDGGWTKHQDKNILLLYLPQFKKEVTIDFQDYQYQWLYEKSSASYLFCFSIDDKEKVIVFQRDFAGRLVTEKEAYQPFDIVVTAIPFDKITDETKMLHLQDITMNRAIEAGW